MKIEKQVLAFSRVSKYYGGRKVLDDISFAFGAGDIVGLVGPNGAGKTTIMRLILGTIKKDAGEIILFGEAVSDRQRRMQNMKIGVVLEKPGFELLRTGYENIGYYAKLLGLDKRTSEERINRLKSELGFEFYLEKPVATYSKGMIKKLSILKSLLNKPEFLILDEPISDVDQETKNTIIKLILYLSAKYGIAILISSHNLNDLEDICTKYIIINKGKLDLFAEKDGINHKGLTLTVKLRTGAGGIPDIGILFRDKLITDYREIPTGFMFDVAGEEKVHPVLRFFEGNDAVVYNYEISKSSLVKKYYELIGDNSNEKEFNIF